MKTTLAHRWPVLLFLLAVIAAAVYFLFPFGLFPKPASPNCGPETRRRLDVRPQTEDDFIDFLREHELELLNGTQLPHLEGNTNPNNIPLGAPIDYDRLGANVQVQRRLGYTVFSLTYTHPACGKNQNYTFRITSFGFASLYGCCGV